MKGSLSRPVYYIYAIDKNGYKYNLKKVLKELNISQSQKELAVKVRINLVNVFVEKKGKYLNDLLNMKDSIFVYADIGNGAKEVFRGIIWTKNYDEDTDTDIGIVAYDHLIYLQKSKDSFYFTSGSGTNDIISSICRKWGISLDYKYGSRTHPKLTLRSQSISDIILDVLNDTKKQIGRKYVVYSSLNVMVVDYTMQNEIVYTIKRKQNLSKIKTSETMEGMITKVVITGTKDNDEKEPVLATVNGNTSAYGTLQDMISKDKDTDLSESQNEANDILKEKGSPFKEKSITAIDNPFIRKGDAVMIDGYPMNAKYTVLSIDHDATNRTMTVEVE